MVVSVPPPWLKMPKQLMSLWVKLLYSYVGNSSLADESHSCITILSILKGYLLYT